MATCQQIHMLSVSEQGVRELLRSKQSEQLNEIATKRQSDAELKIVLAPIAAHDSLRLQRWSTFDKLLSVVNVLVPKEFANFRHELVDLSLLKAVRQHSDTAHIADFSAIRLQLDAAIQTKLNFPECWNHTASPLIGPHWNYVLVQRKLRKSSSELAPKRAHRACGPPERNPKPKTQHLKPWTRNLTPRRMKVSPNSGVSLQRQAWCQNVV